MIGNTSVNVHSRSLVLEYLLVPRKTYKKRLISRTLYSYKIAIWKLPKISSMMEWEKYSGLVTVLLLINDTLKYLELLNF